MEEVRDEPLCRERACGIGIGKARIAAAIRIPAGGGRAGRAQEAREFGTARREVPALAGWLRCRQVPAVVTEPACGYRKPAFCRLEAGGLECVLAGARQVRNLPGRPGRDTCGSRWLAVCLGRGAVAGCFAAAPEFRVIGGHARHRRGLSGERARGEQRAEKLPEPAALKLPSVLAGICGVAGRGITGRLIAGERDPGVLASLARGRAKARARQLREALGGAGFFTPGLAGLLKPAPGRTGRVTAGTGALTAVTERRPAPWQEQLQQAGPVPGRGRRAARDVLAGAGPGMTRFPGPAQVRVCHVLLSSPGMRCHDLGRDYCERERDTARQVSRHAAKLAGPGYEVTLARHPDDSDGGDTQAA